MGDANWWDASAKTSNSLLKPADNWSTAANKSNASSNSLASLDWTSSSITKNNSWSSQGTSSAANLESTDWGVTTSTAGSGGWPAGGSTNTTPSLFDGQKNGKEASEPKTEKPFDPFGGKVLLLFLLRHDRHEYVCIGISLFIYTFQQMQCCLNCVITRVFLL